MLPIEFKEANITFNKPEGMTDEQCMSVSAFKGQDHEGIPVVITKWAFNKEDLEEIAKTGVVYLQVAGNGMPPVSLYTENPFV